MQVRVLVLILIQRLVDGIHECIHGYRLKVFFTKFDIDSLGLVPLSFILYRPS